MVKGFHISGLSAVIKFLKQLVAAPSFSDDRLTIAARLLHLFLLHTIVLIFAYSFFTFFMHLNPVFLWMTSLVMMPLIVLALYFVQKGYVKSVAVVLASTFWIFNTMLIVWGGGLQSPSMINYFTVLLLVGLCLTKTYAVIFLLLTVLSTILLLYCQVHNLLPDRLFFSSTASTWMVFTGNLYLLSILLAVARDKIFKFLHQISESRNKIAKKNEELMLSTYELEEKSDCLQKNELKYKNFIEKSSEIIWLIELSHPIANSLPVQEQIELIFDKGKIIECNDFFLNIYDFKSREDVLQKSPKSIFQDQTLLNLALLLRALIEQGYILRNFESEETGEYTQKHYLLNNAIGLRQDGYLQSIWIMQRDITDLRLSEKFIRAQEARYRNLFDSAGDAIFIMKGDRFIDCNPKALEIFGCSRSQIISHFIDEFSPPTQPDGMDSEKKLAEKIEAALNGQPQSFEWQHQKYDGTLFNADVSISKVGWAAGAHLQAIVRDISSRKRTEEAIRDSEKRYRNIFENIQDIYFELTPDNSVLEISPSIEKFSKLKREEIIGKPVSILYEEMTEDDKIIEDILNFSNITDHEVKLSGQQGRIYFMSINASLLKNEQGNPLKIVGSMRDITQNKLLEEQLQQAQKMEAVGTLAGGIAHDFNNLLTAIIGGADLALLKLSEDDPVYKRIQDIRAAGSRASDLTRQLLAFSRKQVLEAKIININQLITNLEKMLTRLISEDIALISNLNCQDPHIKADPTQIEQVLINLIINARDAMPKGGKIFIETKNVVLDKDYLLRRSVVQPGNYIRLCVSDTGSGIKKELQDKVFDPFFTTKARGKGTGLGLAMVYGIIKQHGGYIWVYSEPEKGATFNIYLPLISGEVAYVAKKEGSNESISRGRETVLIVEDDINVKRLVSLSLSNLGYRVIVAESVGHAQELAAKHTDELELLLTDVIMPGMNGLELFKKISTIRPGIRVLYMSGYNEDIITEKGFLKKDVKFIQKPFSMIDLGQKIREVLDD